MITLLDEMLIQLKDEDQKGMYFINVDADEFFSYRELYISSLKMLHFLHIAGIRENNELVFQIGTPKKFIILFWACILGNIIPVPIAIGNGEEKSDRLKKVWPILNDPFAVFENDIYKLFCEKNEDWIHNYETKILIYDQFNIKDEILPISDLELLVEKKDENRIAFIQFSSGSTGDPKGVTLTHKNLVTNILAIIQRTNASTDESIFSWMPLTHDMGLIGFHLAPLANNMNQYILDTQLFIRSPYLWFEKISKYRIGVTASPNFGYSFYLNHVKEDRRKSLDLSCVRLIFSGAEPISKEVVDEFTQIMSKYGLKKNTMYPVYGLAEASLAVTFPHPGEKVRVLAVNRFNLKLGDKIDISKNKTKDDNIIVSLGRPLNGETIKIIDNNGTELQNETIGIINIKGENITKGYYNNEKATESLISPSGWLNTGDIGFVKDGNLYVTGRLKDIIFVNGQNFYASDLECIAEQVDGIEHGGAVVVGRHNYNNNQEEVIFFLLYKSEDFNKFSILAENLRKQIVQSTGINVNYIIPIKQIPKTPSGKVQRFVLVKNYEESKYDYIIKQISSLRDSFVNKKIMSEIKFTKEQIKMILVNVFQEVLGYRITEFDRSLVELGVDSIKVINVKKKLEDNFNVKIPISIVFDYPTLNYLSDYIYSLIHKEGCFDNKQNNEISNEVRSDFDEKIAIIGMSCRFPGNSNSPEEFWNNLVKNIDCVGKIPDIRWKNIKFDSEANVNSNFKVKNGGFLNGIHLFDNEFFGISPVEAIDMDPQQRILLEVCWEALENSGINVMNLKGTRTANIMGICGHDYTEQTLSDIDKIGPYSFTGSMFSVTSGRISYALGLQGPTMTIDTACSSSLVAVNQASLFLKDHQCDLALAGGVNLIISPKGYVGFSKLNALSEDGKCKSFDDSADGYGRSEGCGAVVLKRLSDAIRDNDNILAVIRGSAINHDGKSSGLTVPNGRAQEDVIKQAMKNAKVSIDKIDYVETHGTGTKIGDPQEVNALANVFHDRSINNKLKIGTVKSNIGHAESASGMAGLLKVVLSLKNGIIPANLHFNTPNKLIPWSDIPIEVVSQNTLWQKDEDERFAGISSFGISGTNVHMIVQGAPQKRHFNNKILKERDYNILTLSAKNSSALDDMRHIYINYLNKSKQRIEDICYTTNISRTGFNNRVSVVGKNIDELMKNLSKLNIKEQKNSNYSSIRKIVFLYTGQGSIYKNIGRELYESSGVFRRTMNMCDQLFSKYIDKSIVSIIYGEDKEENLGNTIYSQPIIFSVEYALTELWKSWGIVPSCVIGHSIGEYAAACVAGYFSLPDAVRIVAARGKTLCKAIQGTMVGVIASEETVSKFINGYDDVSIAAVNGEENVTISGSEQSIKEIIKELKKARIFIQPLNISHAFHSKMMEPFVEEFQKQVEDIIPKKPIINMIWARNKRDIKPSHIEYWTSHIKEPIRFLDMIREANEQGYNTYLEIGGTSVLSGLGSQILINNRESIFAPSLREGKNCWKQIFESLGELYTSGVNVNWNAIDRGLYRNKVVLPTYPFKRVCFWKNGNMIEDRNCIYTLDWIESELNAKVTDKLDGRKFIIFTDKKSLGNNLYNLIKKYNGQCILVRAGDSFKKSSSTLYDVNPSSKESMEILFKEIGNDMISGSSILYLWGIDVVSNEKLTLDILKSEIQKLCSGIMFIMQILTLMNIDRKPQVWIVTQDTQDLGKETKYISLSPSTLWGFGREIDFEFPEYWGGLIDVDENVLKNQYALILNEILSKQDNQVVLRRNKRYTAVFNRSRNFESNKKININENNAYLITGGLGDLGLFFANSLAEKGAKNLILIGRHRPNNNAASILSQLEEQGLNIKVIIGDVANSNDLKKIGNYLSDSKLELSGIIHAAGINRKVKFSEHSWKNFYEVLSPKVMGTWNLYKEFNIESLDFFILFSSISSILGSIGHIDYIVANNFMNSFAAYANKNKFNTTSINWGPWAQIGMGYREGAENLSLIGLNSISPDESINLAELALNNKMPIPFIADIEWNKYLGFCSDGQKNGLLRNFENIKENKKINKNSGSDLLNKLKNSPESERKDMLINYIQKLSAQILGFNDYSKVSVTIPLMEQGFDSLMSVKLRNEIYNLTEKELPITFLFNYPTIEKASNYILENVLDLSGNLIDKNKLSEVKSKTVNLETTEDILDELEKLFNKN